MNNIEKFAPTKEGPRFLDRERLAPIMQKISREVVEQHLLELFRIAKHKEEYKDRDEAKILYHLGKSLIRYEGIDRSVYYMDELQNKFRDLGYDIAFLTDSLKSSGLVYEEFKWLGSLIRIPGKAGAEQFNFADTLSGLPPIEDCNDQEKVRLYFAYLEGQTSYWNKKQPYGSSPKGKESKK